MPIQFEKIVTTTYRWWEAGGLEIDQEHLTKLNQVAELHIKIMVSKGFDHGELPIQTYSTHDLMYTGYWENKVNYKKS